MKARKPAGRNAARCVKRTGLARANESAMVSADGNMVYSVSISEVWQLPSLHPNTIQERNKSRKLNTAMAEP